MTAQGITKDAKAELAHDHADGKRGLDQVSGECGYLVFLVIEIEIAEHRDDCK